MPVPKRGRDRRSGYGGRFGPRLGYRYLPVSLSASAAAGRVEGIVAIAGLEVAWRVSSSAGCPDAASERNISRSSAARLMLPRSFPPTPCRHIDAGGEVQSLAVGVGAVARNQFIDERRNGVRVPFPCHFLKHLA